MRLPPELRVMVYIKIVQSGILTNTSIAAYMFSMDLLSLAKRAFADRQYTSMASERKARLAWSSARNPRSRPRRCSSRS